MVPLSHVLVVDECIVYEPFTKIPCRACTIIHFDLDFRFFSILESAFEHQTTVNNTVVNFTPTGFISLQECAFALQLLGILLGYLAADQRQVKGNRAPEGRRLRLIK